jgi:hypothetical protein
MPSIPTELPVQARHGLAKIGLDEAALAILGAGDNVVESEQAFRQAGRLRAVKADAARVKASEAREERMNAAGVRQLERASAEFEKARKGLNREARREIEQAVGKKEFRDRLAESRETFKEDLVTSDLSGEEVEELIEIWDEAQGALDEGGFDQLLNKGREKADEARASRGQKNRGREAHSPLSTWKYAIIAGALVIGVAAIIACFVWFACSWVAPLLTFFGLGWITEMIKKGCPPIPAVT